MKRILAALFWLTLGALISAMTPLSAAAVPAVDLPAVIARTINALVDTIAETDPSFRVRFLKRLAAGYK